MTAPRLSVCVIFNPTARGEKAATFRRLLNLLSSECTLRPTIGPGSAQSLAAEAVRAGFHTIVAAGGDGTLNEVLNGIAEVEDGFTRARLAVLPLGTVNVFAKELGLPSSLQAAWEVVRAGHERRIDVARADFVTGAGPAHRYFAQMAGAGWDARAVELVDWEWKKKVGAFAYVTAGLKALREPAPRIVVESDGQRTEGELVLIGNGVYYGGRWRVFPKASLCDGLLEASIFPRVNWSGILRGSLGLLMGQLYSAGGVRHLRGQSIHLTSDPPALFHVEGEKAGRLPATFSVEERKLRVVTPA